MEPFEIKNLFTINGNPGLWRLRRYMPKQRMANLSNLLDDFKTTTVHEDKIIKIDNWTIHLRDGSQRKLEDVFDYIMGIKEPLPEDFSKLSADDKKLWMEKLVPNYDVAFKSYHLERILKWYKDIMAAIAILNDGIEDPEDQVIAEQVTENADEIHKKLDQVIDQIGDRIDAMEEKINALHESTFKNQNPNETKIDSASSDVAADGNSGAPGL
jgi:hypothetical protein